MASQLVVTPGGYRPPEMVHKIGDGLKLRILTGRLQGVDASGAPVADFGSVPRDGSNPALTPGYALPPGIDTPEGSEPAPPLGRGWMAFAHWTNEGSAPITSFRATWTVPPEPASQSGQTIFLFLAMQDSIPMTLLPALQWGPSAAGGGDYWSVASWYVGGTTGVVFHGELMPVNAGDELTGFITLGNRRREHCDYRCGFEGLGDVDLPVHGVRQLSRCGEILAAYGIKRCSDYPDASAASFRNIEIATGFTRPALAWTPANAITDCGQHVVVLSDANPGGEIDVHFRQLDVAAVPEPEPEPMPEAIVGEPEMEPELVAAAAEAVSDESEVTPVAAEVTEEAVEPEPGSAPIIAEAVLIAAMAEAVAPDNGEAAPLVAPAMDVLPEPMPEAAALETATTPEPEPVMAGEEETAPEDSEILPFVAAAIEVEPATIIVEPELDFELAAMDAAEGEVALSSEVIEEAPEPIATQEPIAAEEPVAAPAFTAAEPEPVEAAAEAAQIRTRVTEQPLAPATLAVSPSIGRLVEITIHNHSPAGSASAALEARLAALEATVAAFAQRVSSGGQTEGSPSDNGDVTARLERLARLQGNGALTYDEFAAAKAQILGQAVGSDGTSASSEVVLR